MSLRIVDALIQNESVIRTALDDLESFLWVLIWGIVYASKDIEGAREVNKGIDYMLSAWSGDLRYNKSEQSADTVWKDAVFGDLIKKWMSIFKAANERNGKLLEHLPSIPTESKWTLACDVLETRFTDVYEEVLKFGFAELRKVEKYSDWTRVVAATAQSARSEPADLKGKKWFWKK
jgi:hypothetical protein